MDGVAARLRRGARALVSGGCPFMKRTRRIQRIVIGWIKVRMGRSMMPTEGTLQLSPAADVVNVGAKHTHGSST